MLQKKELIMKKSFIYLLCVIHTVGFIQAQECSIKPNQRSLIILPDTAGEESLQLFGYYTVNNFQTDILEKIMLSQAAPVMVELSIWKRFTNKMKKEKRPLNTLPFEYYKIERFLLCIPETWKKQFADTGFNLTHLKKVKDPFALMPRWWDPLKGYVKSLLTLANVYTSLVKAIRTAIVSNKTFNWNIVLFGHGGPALGSHTARVAGIPFDEFKKLLRFLNNEINTDILLYQTCYAGSKWLLKSYITNDKPDTYNYPIILTGLSEAPVYSWSVYRQTSIYEQFFQKIKTIALCKQNLGPLSLIAGILLQAISVSKQTGKLALTSANNILQIRWPNNTQFKTIEIGNIIASARKAAKKTTGKALSISTQAFILDTPYLDRSVNLMRSDHQIVSALPIKTHYIKSITLAQKYPNPTSIIKKLLSYFTGTKKLATSKIFLIDTVTDTKGDPIIKNVMVSLKRTSLLGQSLPEINEIFYVIGDQGYRIKQDDAQPVPLDAKRTNRYIKHFEEYKETAKHFEEKK